jgi:hypothetical protein
MTIAKPDDMASLKFDEALRAVFVFVRENLGLSVGKDKYHRFMN